MDDVQGVPEYINEKVGKLGKAIRVFLRSIDKEQDFYLEVTEFEPFTQSCQLYVGDDLYSEGMLNTWNLLKEVLAEFNILLADAIKGEIVPRVANPRDIPTIDWRDSDAAMQSMEDREGVLDEDYVDTSVQQMILVDLAVLEKLDLKEFFVALKKRKNAFTLALAEDYAAIAYEEIGHFVPINLAALILMLLANKFGVVAEDLQAAISSVFPNGGALGSQDIKKGSP